MNLEKLITEKHLENTVHLAGEVPEARTYLKAFDIFTLTSRKEGLPYALLEASAAGIPAVASKIGGIPEIIDDNQTGILIEAGNDKQIAQAIEKLLDNPSLRSQMGRAAVAKTSSQFTLEQMISETKALY
jgi:glycosyltransferase involved in cell wall biosynthesis